MFLFVHEVCFMFGFLQFVTFISKDTNPLPFRSLCAILGVSATRNFVMNSVTVPRLPAEAVGGICKLKDLKTWAKREGWQVTP